MMNFADKGLAFRFRSGFRMWFIACGLQLVVLISVASPMDSLRMETINGKQFIIHQIEAKETLYSISRRYSVPVTAILENNPTSDGGLAIGQLLKIPYVPHAKHRTENGITYHKVAAHETLFSIARMYSVTVDDVKSWNKIPETGIKVGQELVIRKKTFETTTQSSTAPPIQAQPTTTTPIQTTTPSQSLKGVHTVTAKETLYSISRMYGATVTQLKEWNNLTGNEVKPGQTLYVVQPMYSTTEKPKDQPKQAEVVQPTTVTPPTTTQVTKPTQEIKISEGIPGTDEVQENGTATLIEGTEGSRKYQAQHKSIKVGSIVKVRNASNNQEVFVRIVGTLPSSDENVIKISKSAYDRLGATDPKVNVVVIYYK
jgi:LysM repeat protein